MAECTSRTEDAGKNQQVALDSHTRLTLRTRVKITSHFARRFIPPGCGAKTRNILIFQRFRVLPCGRLDMQNCELILTRALRNGNEIT